MTLVNMFGEKLINNYMGIWRGWNLLDKRIDERLTDLNARYQAQLHSNHNYKEIKTDRYLSNIKKLDFAQIAKDLKYRKYAKRNFSTHGNVVYDEADGDKIIDGKIAVYTCIIGPYDSIIEPVYLEPGIDYFIYTDQDVPDNSAWIKRDVRKIDNYNMLSPAKMNRKIKILQTEELLSYDYTVYVDGNIEIVSGITPLIQMMNGKELGVHYHRSRDCIYDEVVAVKHLKHITSEEMDNQLAQYKQEGFPRHFGLYENSILIRNNRIEETQLLMNDWWDEYTKHPTRDQLSLPYVIWKRGYDKKKIMIMGNDVEMNPRFNRYYNHLK